jgi:hypothetical protein
MTGANGISTAPQIAPFLALDIHDIVLMIMKNSMNAYLTNPNDVSLGEKALVLNNVFAPGFDKTPFTPS